MEKLEINKTFSTKEEMIEYIEELRKGYVICMVAYDKTALHGIECVYYTKRKGA